MWTRRKRQGVQKKKCLKTRQKRQKLKALLYVDKLLFRVEKLRVINKFFKNRLKSPLSNRLWITGGENFE